MRECLIFIFFFTLIFINSQSLSDITPKKNLVPNGSFENYRSKSNDLKKAIPWRPIETVDFYQNALKNDTTFQKGAYNGYCYVGLRFRKRYKEFIQVKLVEPLHRGSVYEFSMHLRLAFWSNAALSSFGALFSKGGYKNEKDIFKSNMIDTVCVRGGLEKGHQWFEVNGFYRADGGEKYITIGNFSQKIKKDMNYIDVFRFGARESYYFVDDIKLVKSIQFEEKVEIEVLEAINSIDLIDSVLIVKKDVKVGEKMILKNIFFEYGKHYLLAESNIELNKLTRYLITNSDIEIQINGHSDSGGLNFKNQKMSELRAREVFEYLISKGVQNKMYFKGLGSTQPISDNYSEEGRAKNRRVEFEIIKK